MRKEIFALVSLSLIGLAVYWWYGMPPSDGGSQPGGRSDKTAAVEVAPIERGALEDLRSFTGTLEANAAFVVAPKVSGRITRLLVDLADQVARDQLVAELDDAEYQQDVASAKAELDVERANYAEAQGLLSIAQRELERISQMRARGDVSESQLDQARSEHLARQAQVQVGAARIERAQADLAAARIRLGYTKVRANWEDGDAPRVVAQRYVHAGETVAANAELLKIVDLNPIIGVFHITEKDYAQLRVGMAAHLSTDAYPGVQFAAAVKRISPVFSEATRQARIELEIDNSAQQLKPGMFVRAQIVLQRIEGATIVPQRALVRRDGREGVFMLSADRRQARWVAVEVLIRERERVALREALEGEVVVLGQQLLSDGAALQVVGGAAQ